MGHGTVAMDGGDLGFIGQIAYSTDKGQTWKASDTTASGFGSISGVTCGSGAFVAVAAGQGFTPTPVKQTTNGTNKTIRGLCS